MDESGYCQKKCWQPFCLLRGKELKEGCKGRLMDLTLLRRRIIIEAMKIIPRVLTHS